MYSSAKISRKSTQPTDSTVSSFLDSSAQHRGIEPNLIAVKNKNSQSQIYPRLHTLTHPSATWCSNLGISFPNIVTPIDSKLKASCLENDHRADVFVLALAFLVIEHFPRGQKLSTHLP